MAFDDWNYAAPDSTGGPQQTIPLSPGNPSDWNYAAPGTTGGPMQTMGASQPPPPSLWDKLQEALGQGNLPKTSMPGTTFAPPAGAGTAPVFPPGPTPPGMGAYFNAIQNPPASGSNLAARYAALQQLMRGR
jgi:hypothetical protein